MLTIVPVQASDLDQLAVLSRELCGRTVNMARLRDAVEKMLANHDYILLGAKDAQQRLVGFVMAIICLDIVGDCRPFAVMENLIVAEKARGLGAGRMLVAAIEQQARDRDCYYLMFNSLAERKQAHQFYARIGYAKGIVEGFKRYL
ncbi:MAG: GNAT family N-acetyltransferase [Sporomusaceae bacterium]|nr:GNAT family N-acetyltransferase [Sporomusaceae bacterium]